MAIGADLEPDTLLAAYVEGVFPMPLDRRALGRLAALVRRQESVLGWFSPDPRGVLPLSALRVSRSLRSSARRFLVRVDTAFDEVVRRCGDPSRADGWITAEVADAYARLHRLGHAHSVEAWTPDGRLAGGLYGVEVGGLFAGESMWHERDPWARDASKVALLRLVERLRSAGVDAGDTGRRVLDVQWATPHLRTLGAVEIPRESYLAAITEALRLPPAL